MVNMHEFTIRRHIREGKLPAVKVGGRLRIKTQDLDRFIVPARVREEPEPPAGASGKRRWAAIQRILRRRDEIGQVDIPVTELIEAGSENDR